MKDTIEDIDLLLSFKFYNTLETDDEKIAREYYESREFTVINTRDKKALLNVLKSKNLFLDIKKSGIPDFFIFNLSEHFFVEAKSGNYFLKQNQIEWIKNNREKVIIFWLRKPKHNIYFEE